ncbi:TetR/AcrR family transcriptional regulator [Moritella sp. 24]|uniref:TetR/AcrR family transcriptional regulator n=1 Tax=Moritella sp. 24 TaxID=2746230 RepID=UPI001BAA9A91|nr:TetR/AcrR family transcriptional regulator [Moritella sp. 24]QUM74921.1 TetR/AcrR family transcriptional regulator [Moritella sp. 24]
MKTRDKIIHSALELFNECGERNITTNHIAAHLGISPGNLYYHFRNKEDIIDSIFEQYVNYLAENFQPHREGEVTLEVMMRYLDSMFETMWRFRFFYYSLPILLSRDPNLHKKYLKFQEVSAQREVDLLFSLQKNNVVNVPIEDLDELANSIKVVLVSWVSYRTTISKDAKVYKTDIYRGILKSIFMMKPYFTEKALVDYQHMRDYYLRLANVDTVTPEINS